MCTCAVLVSCVTLVGLLHSTRSFECLTHNVIGPGGNLDVSNDKHQTVSSLGPQYHYLQELVFPQVATDGNNKAQLQDSNHELYILKFKSFKKEKPFSINIVLSQNHSKSCFRTNSKNIDETCFTQNTRERNIKTLRNKKSNHYPNIIAIENVLNKTKSFLNEWTAYKKLNTDTVCLPCSAIDNQIEELIFNLIPNSINHLSTESSPKKTHDQSDFLQSPFLLSVPSIQRSVSQDNDQPFLNQILDQLKTKRKNNKQTPNSDFVKRKINPYLEHYNDWKWPTTKDEEKREEKKKNSLDKTIQNQESVINQMTVLENELEKLKVRNTYQPQVLYEIKIKRIEKELELLEEKNSELYYKKQLFSQRTVY